MPTSHARCLTCERCGWKAVWRGGDAIILTRFDCPACRGTLQIGTPSAVESLNPLYRLNYLRLLASAGADSGN